MITIPQAIAADYERWRTFMYDKVDFALKTSKIHTKEHCSRVLLFALSMADKLNLPQEEKDVLAMASVFHDTRRLNDRPDVGHGARAAAYYKQYCAEHGLPYEQRTYDAMAFHDQEDALGIRTIESRVPREQDAVLIYQIFKDADALDRYRLGPGGFDPSYLRNQVARDLLGYAKEVWENWDK